MNGHGADAQPLRGQDLVAHQGEQGADEEGGTCVRLAQDPRRQEINDTFAPSRALDDEDALALIGGEINSFPLSITEFRGWTQHLLEECARLLLLQDRKSVV